MAPEPARTLVLPDAEALAEARRWAVVVETEANAPRWRVSLSTPSLCAARDVVFLAAGAGKRPVLEEIRRDPAAAAQRFPAAAVRPASSLLWLVDREAAPAE